MTFPKTIKVGGIIYEVKLVKGLADCGSTVFNSSTILINKDQTEDRQYSALLHEIIECVVEANDIKIEHSGIQTLEANLFQVYKDNIIL